MIIILLVALFFISLIFSIINNLPILKLPAEPLVPSTPAVALCRRAHCLGKPRWAMGTRFVIPGGDLQSYLNYCLSLFLELLIATNILIIINNISIIIQVVLCDLIDSIRALIQTIITNIPKIGNDGIFFILFSSNFTGLFKLFKLIRTQCSILHKLAKQVFVEFM